MRGSFKKKEGKVIEVDLKTSSALVEGVVRKKQSGKEVNAPVHASKLLIIELAARTPKRKEKREAKAEAKRETNAEAK
jgi:ribosomal protein uL24